MEPSAHCHNSGNDSLNACPIANGVATNGSITLPAVPYPAIAKLFLSSPHGTTRVPATLHLAVSPILHRISHTGPPPIPRELGLASPLPSPALTHGLQSQWNGSSEAKETQKRCVNYWGMRKALVYLKQTKRKDFGTKRKERLARSNGLQVNR